MRAIAFWMAGGAGALAGLALVALAATLGVWRPGIRLRARRVVGVVGVVLVVLSAVPLPPSWCGAAVLALVGWFAAERRGSVVPGRGRAAATLLAVAAVVGVALELPWRRDPALPAVRHVRLVVIGDSLAAGTGRGETTWPKLVARHHGVPLDDYSQEGALVRHAVRAVAREPLPEDALVVVEIGGNDLLVGRDGATGFARDFEDLLARLAGPHRTVVVLELPLPPFAQAIGAAQRRIAVAHGALLVPRRHLAAVLADAAGTLDGLHLDDRGHATLAQRLSELIGPLLVAER